MYCITQWYQLVSLFCYSFAFTWVLLFWRKNKICRTQAHQFSRIYYKVKIVWLSISQILFIAVSFTVFLEQKVCTKFMNSKLACKKTMRWNLRVLNKFWSYFFGESVKPLVLYLNMISWLVCLLIALHHRPLHNHKFHFLKWVYCRISTLFPSSDVIDTLYILIFATVSVMKNVQIIL